jgi:hypothetical protein
MDRATIRERFTDACEVGNLILAKELTKTYNLETQDARSIDNRALQWACGNGHTSTAQWLVETFNLTSGDVRSQNNCALRLACARGHTSTAQWLLDTFYTTEDALQMSKLKYISKKMEEFLENYQPIGAFTKFAQM